MPHPDNPQVSREELCEHMALLAVATAEDFDELLGDLLRLPYPTLATQIG
jgi:hypothetical protein